VSFFLTCIRDLLELKMLIRSSNPWGERGSANPLARGEAGPNDVTQKSAWREPYAVFLMPFV